LRIDISTLSFRPEAPKYKMRQTEEQKQSLRDALGKLDISDDARRALEILSTGQSIPYDLIAAIAKHIDKTSSKDEGVLIL
jgi:ABC-type enterochelin transport system ATPase subunit